MIADLHNEVKAGLSFGERNTVRMGGLLIRTSLLLIPGILIGHSIDQAVNKLKRKNKLGTNTVVYVLLQSIIMFLALYSLIFFIKSYADEFQNTYSGLFFVALFFGMQTNYISNIQHVLSEL